MTTAVTMRPVRTSLDGRGDAPRQTVFDQRHYVELIEARAETIRRVVENLKVGVRLRMALDAR